MSVRATLVGVVLLAVFLSGLATPAFEGERFAGDEPRHLSAAAALASGEGAAGAPKGIGFPLLLTPAHALGGSTAVQIWLALLAALGFVAAAVLARHVVPEPYASGGALAVGLSAPAVAYATTVYPDLVAGAGLATAVLLAVRLRERPRLAEAVWAGVLLAALPWLAPQFALPGAVVLLTLTVWMLRRRRALGAVLAAEVVGASVIAYISVNDTLYDRLTPYEGAGVELDRLGRLLTLWIDADHGALRWAPALVLAFVGAFVLWRSRRGRLARAIPGHREAEAAAGLSAAVCVAVVAVAVLVAPSDDGEWFGPRHLVAALPCASVLVAWGLRRLPRVGTAIAAAGALLTLSLLTALHAGWVDGWIGTSWPV